MALSRGIPAEGPPLRAFVDRPSTGMVCSARRHEGEWVKFFLKGNRAGTGQTHGDKGNFVLKFAGDSFAMDFGVVDCSNPLVEERKTAQCDNRLTPWSTGLRPRPANPTTARIRAQGRGGETSFHATMDVAAGWADLFTRWRRAWDSTTNSAAKWSVSASARRNSAAPHNPPARPRRRAGHRGATLQELRKQKGRPDSGRPCHFGGCLTPRARR